MRHQVDLELPAPGRVDGQAHAVDGDRALGRDVARERRGQLERHDRRAARGRDRDDPAHAVDVARHPMAVERVADAQGGLEIHARAAFEAAERRDGERRPRDVGRERARV